ncbi:esterase E4-like [Planococcus citri]|uniref:esterase E4-like n=1 Tax=Planococcus citri TaxID=170843 RepID=UPI0031F7D0AD
MSEKVIVTVNEGKVRGFKTKSDFSGVEYYTFLGVPYGQPPVRSARFKDPVKVKPWNNILDATNEKPGCLQFSIIKRCIIGSEDCLYNNIYTPKLPSKGDPLKSVVVCIHPGGMFHGSPEPSYFGAPDYLMHHDIVYVAMGYRLHAFGLLNLSIKNCTGNQSIKDMILSLQWIKQNIHTFGGDPNNVTLIGSSSGSAYVHFLLLSPLAKGLYHKAILMGMYVFNPLLVHSRDNITVAYDVAQSMGYIGEKEDSKKLLNFYRNLDYIRLITARSEKQYSKNKLQAFPASPFIPAEDASENSPLPSSPEKLIRSTNRVPIIIGFCQKECAMGVAYLQASQQSIADIFHTAISQNCWGWGANLSNSELKQIQKEVEDFYLNGMPIEKASKLMLCDILTDAALSDVYDSLINVIAADLPSSVFVYNFHYDGALDGMKVKITEIMQTEIEGAFHAADYCYWSFMGEIAGKHAEKIPPKDREVIETFTSYLTTFARTGNPNYEKRKLDWNPTTPEHPSHIIIGETLERKDEILNGQRLEFWHKLKKKYTKK